MKKNKNSEIEAVKKEALRFYENARELLKRGKPDYEIGIYMDIKYVQEAFGALWLAILKAIDYRLLTAGLDFQKLPQNKKEYDIALKKLKVYNGKLKTKFDSLWKIIHVSGYYRGNIDDIKMIKDAFRSAKGFIDYLLTLKKEKLMGG